MAVREPSGPRTVGPDATSLVRGLTACMREGPTSTTPWHDGWKQDDGGQEDDTGWRKMTLAGPRTKWAWRLGRHTGVTAVKTKKRDAITRQMMDSGITRGQSKGPWRWLAPVCDGRREEAGRRATTTSAGQVFMHSILRHIATVGAGGRTW